jgi:hypothetical protein
MFMSSIAADESVMPFELVISVADSERKYSHLDSRPGLWLDSGVFYRPVSFVSDSQPPRTHYPISVLFWNAVDPAISQCFLFRTDCEPAEFSVDAYEPTVGVRGERRYSYFRQERLMCKIANSHRVIDAVNRISQ